MSKNKTPPPPLVTVKFAYADALEEVLQQANMLAVTVGTAIKLGQVSDKMVGDLKERLIAFHRAYVGDEP